MITEERREYLLWAWENERYPEDEEWRDGLTPEEEELVKGWDKGYESGMARLCERKEEQKNER